MFRYLFLLVDYCTLEIIPALIGAAAVLGGAALSAKGSRDAAEDARAHSEWQQEMNYRQQKEFAQMGVRWRVDDAKAAGLHPLYALGANTPTFSPSVTSFQPENALADMGQAVGRVGEYVANYSQRGQQKRLENAQIRLVEAQANKEEVAAMALASEIGRSAQAATTWQAYPAATDALLGVDKFMGDYRGRDSHFVGPGGAVPLVSVSPAVGAVKVNPSETTSVREGDISREAASAPLLKEYNTGFGFPLLLPSKEASESLESIEPLGAAWIVSENIRYYGWQAVQWLWKWADHMRGSIGPAVKGEIRKLERR